MSKFTASAGGETPDPTETVSEFDADPRKDGAVEGIEAIEGMGTMLSNGPKGPPTAE